MSLITWRYESRRRPGKCKGLEQAGDWQRLYDHLIQLSIAHGDHATAEELRAQLNPSRVRNLDESPAYTPEPPKPRRKRKSKSPTPSLSDKSLREAWCTVDELRGRAD